MNRGARRVETTSGESSLRPYRTRALRTPRPQPNKQMSNGVNSPMRAIIILVFTALACGAASAQQEQNFTPAPGGTFQAKQDSATSQAAAAHQARFWTAYSFDVRPGVAVD